MADQQEANESTVQKVQKLQNSLFERCKVLVPSCVCRGNDDRSLLALCRDETQIKKRLDILVESAKSCCEFCGVTATFPSEYPKETDSTEHNILHFITTYRFELKDEILHHVLTSGKFGCDKCTLAHDTNAVLTLSTSLKESDHTKLRELLLHFSEVNDIDAFSDEEKCALSQECYSLAYALKTVTSNIPHLNTVDSKGNRLTAIPVDQLLREILSPPPVGSKTQITPVSNVPTPSKKHQTSKKTPRSKKRKTKK